MLQLYFLFLIILLVLFFMYAYKKKCDEDLFICLIEQMKQQQNNFHTNLGYNHYWENNLKYQQFPISKCYYNKDYYQNDDKDYFNYYNYKTPHRYSIYNDFENIENKNYRNLTINNFYKAKNNDCIYKNKFQYGHRIENNNKFLVYKIAYKVKIEEFLSDTKKKHNLNYFINSN